MQLLSGCSVLSFRSPGKEKDFYHSFCSDKSLAISLDTDADIHDIHIVLTVSSPASLPFCYSLLLIGY